MTSTGGGQPRTVDVPLTAPAASVSYTLPPGVTFDVEAVYVEVDASGAGGAVTAELTIAEQSGVVIAKKTQAATIDAGGNGSATWAIRLADDVASTGGGGLQFDTDPQAGDWFFAEVDSSGGPGNYGWHIYDPNNNGIYEQTPFFRVNDGDGTHVVFVAQSTGVGVRCGISGQFFQVTNDTDNTKSPVFRAVAGIADTSTVGFFGAVPVVQAAHPVTLADVIAILTNLGLCA